MVIEARMQWPGRTGLGGGDDGELRAGFRRHVAAAHCGFGRGAEGQGFSASILPVHAARAVGGVEALLLPLLLLDVWLHAQSVQIVQGRLTCKGHGLAGRGEALRLQTIQAGGGRGAPGRLRSHRAEGGQRRGGGE